MLKPLPGRGWLRCAPNGQSACASPTKVFGYNRSRRNACSDSVTLRHGQHQRCIISATHQLTRLVGPLFFGLCPSSAMFWRRQQTCWVIDVWCIAPLLHSRSCRARHKGPVSCSDSFRQQFQLIATTSSPQIATCQCIASRQILYLAPPT